MWWLAYVLAASPALAEEPALPTAAARVSIMSGLPDLLGVSATVVRPVTVEAGASSFLLGFSFYGRAGVPIVLGTKPEPRAAWWVTPLVGYRFLHFKPYEILEDQHRVTGQLAIDYAYWFRPAVAVDVQLAAGADWIAWRSRGGPGAVAPDVRLSVGLAF